MIYKELDPLDWEQQTSVTQRRVDEQMPYYLRRYFGSSPEIDVINQLCVRTGGVVTRVDHLILHAFGLIVIDSRSVLGSYRVHSDGRWLPTQRHLREREALHCPVRATAAQAVSLRAFLLKKVRQKEFFERVNFDVLVAVPDVDAIEWGDPGPRREVCNADQVVREVHAVIARQQAAQGGAGPLVPVQRRRLAEFLCFKHLPELAAQPAVLE
jgi:Nuclease-related domain